MIAQARSVRDTLLDKIRDGTALVAVVGIGRVGLPFAVECAKHGLRVIAVDRNPVRVTQLNQGSNYLRHVDDGDVIALVEEGRLRATGDEAVLHDADVIVVCIAAPLDHARSPDFGPVRRVAETIAERLRPGQLIVLENGTYPGITRDVLLPTLRRSSLEIGIEYFVALAPERVDPGNHDYHAGNTTRVVAGVTPDCLPVACAFYQRCGLTVVGVRDPRVAELTKVFENAFRAVNVALVTELAVLCDRLGVSVWDVIEAAATKPFGMMRFEPGPGVGGSAVPHDPQYLAWEARRRHAPAHFLEAAAEINASMPYFVREKVARVLNQQGKALKGASVLVVGIAYKRDVPDPLDSPVLVLASALEDDGATVRYHDPLIPSVGWPDGTRRVSTPLDADALAEADCVVIGTDHTGIDWKHVVAHARAVLDTRNATRGVVDGHEKVTLL